MISHSRYIPLVLAGCMPFVACSGDDTPADTFSSPTLPQETATPTQPAADTPTQATGETPTDPQATPTAAATPPSGTPTAAATPTNPPSATYDQGYRTNSWVVSNSVGVDLNGDTVIDNQFVDVYELSITVISFAVYEGTKQFLLENEVNEPQAESLAHDVQVAFDTFMTVENFNALIAGAISSDALNFAETLIGEPEGLSLTWYSAVSLSPGSYALRSVLGAQSGTTTLGATAMSVGPGNLTYDFSSIYDGPLASSILLLSGEAILVVANSYSNFDYSEAVLSNGNIGGLVSQDAMLNFMRGLVPIGFCSPQSGDCENFDILADTLEELETVYTDPSNASLWSFELNGQPAVPVGFGWAATQAELVDEVGQGGIN